MKKSPSYLFIWKLLTQFNLKFSWIKCATMESGDASTIDSALTYGGVVNGRPETTIFLIFLAYKILRKLLFLLVYE